MVWKMTSLLVDTDSDRDVKLGLMELTIVESILDTLGTRDVITVDSKELKLVDKVDNDGITDVIKVESIVESVGKMVVSTVDLNEDRELSNVENSGKTVLETLLSKVDRLVASMLFISVTDDKLASSSDTLSLRKATHAAPANIPNSPNRLNKPDD